MTTTTLSTVMLLMLLVALALGSVLPDERRSVNCAPNRPCTADAIPHCIKGWDIPIFGNCDLLDALCSGEEEDFSGSCMVNIEQSPDYMRVVVSDSETSNPDERRSVNCGHPRPCTLDLIPHCIKGWDIPIFGNCALVEALCNGEEEDHSDSCMVNIDKSPYYMRVVVSDSETSDPGV
ncbi:uncharacterized protein LOC112566787 [Pomacea canaliculata]|uniref:uncharacterized protein LOC112566787 n=1 Tax=Pomacea canaliculata TaxID=400727 RepID=UPI000D72AE52|nr:uncharacterized protein LOC112566787 [Pomacea canaliculata]XP_025098931.1 uncharacterized protein LOC112566787 [Pomacea canaliculata]XP_025098932.1 uncharacterized protein LOC112566787 [Pomacea canaliculata]